MLPLSRFISCPRPVTPPACAAGALGPQASIVLGCQALQKPTGRFRPVYLGWSLRFLVLGCVLVRRWLLVLLQLLLLLGVFLRQLLRLLLVLLL